MHNILSIGTSTMATTTIHENRTYQTSTNGFLKLPEAIMLSITKTTPRNTDLTSGSTKLASVKKNAKVQFETKRHTTKANDEFFTNRNNGTVVSWLILGPWVINTSVLINR